MQTAGEMLEVMENLSLDEDADREVLERALRAQREVQDILWMRGKGKPINLDDNSRMQTMEAHDAAYTIVERMGEVIDLISDQLATYEGEM